MKNGWFFKIAEKEFERDVIAEADIGDITPRRYFDYEFVPGDHPFVKE